MTKLAWFISFLVGFISLSEEIIWVRIVSFSFESTPKAFAMVLTAFLGGIALGALVGKRLSEQQRATPITAAWLMLLSGSLLLVLPGLIETVSALPLALVWMLLLILIGAAMKGMLFPVVHHIGSVYDDSVGRSVSRTYFSNIVGSALGPLVTGLFLLNYFSSGTSLQILGVLCLVGAIVPLAVALRSRQKRFAALGFYYLIAGILLLHWFISSGQNLMHKLAFVGDGEVRILIENRYGVIHAVSNGGANDTVFGGNVYDGNTNIDLVDNSNRIDRAYLLYGLHPKPKRVLVIGLASGAWTRIITAIPSVEKIDVVEINPGYIDLIRKYPNLSPLLEDPRLTIHIDDGRRWLRRSKEKFDLIVMNTTFHWRSYITNLLSIEMMKELKNSLENNGIIAFNTTGSSDSFYTASKAFNYAFRFRNFVYAADHDFRDQVQFVGSRLKFFSLNENLIFQGTVEEKEALIGLTATQFTELEQVERASQRPLMTVTDQNMITEFRFGRGYAGLQE
jgi:spermidine synthase